MIDAPPSTLGDGRFTVVRRLGSGGLGTVWLTRDLHLGGRLAAVKVLRDDVATGHAPERLRREAMLMARLRHPGLIEVYDVSLEGPERYIAQEYVDGSDLATVLARTGGPLPPEAVRRLARELAETLAYLHAQGVVHRDVKPANVMIQLDGRSRLADLGLAVAENSTRFTKEGGVLGTLLYMPPESARGEPLAPSADVYSYGHVIWEAATAQHVFGDVRSMTEGLLRLAGGRMDPPPPPEGMAPELGRLLTACLQPDPSLRPADGTRLLERLATTWPSAPPPASDDASDPSRGSALRRLRGPALAALTALLALALLLPLGGPAPPPPTAPASWSLPAPAVGCLLDGVELRLPRPPPPGTTAHLLTTEGTLLVERPMRGPAVTLHAPPGFVGPLRWAIRCAGTSVDGRAAVGPRLLFDPATLTPAPRGGILDLAFPPLLARGRLVLGAAPSRLLVLEPRQRAGEPLALEPSADRSLGNLPSPGRPPDLPPQRRLTHAVAALAPAGPDAAVALLYGSPATEVLVPLGLPGAATYTTRPDVEVVDALAVPRPGGGSVWATDLRRTGPDGPRREVVLSFLDGALPAPGRIELVLRGRTPLGLAPLDPDRVLLAWVTDTGVVASIVRSEATTARVVATLPVGSPGPAFRNEKSCAWRTLDRGGAALALADHLVVARPDGWLFARPLSMDPAGGVGGLAQGADGSVLVVMTGYAATLITGGATMVQAVAIDDASAPVPPPERLYMSMDGLGSTLPLGLVPSLDGGLFLYSGGLLLDLEGPPRYARRSALPVDRSAGWMVEGDGAVFIVTTRGRVHGFDLPGGR